MSFIQHLVNWVGTCENIEGAHKTADDLLDGVALAEVFAQISPERMKLNLIKRDAKSNPHLRVANLRKVLSACRSFYEDELGMSISENDLPAINLIGENEDLNELAKLIVLVLSCAVQCAAKEDFVQRIMQMQEDEQHVIMQAIQEIFARGRKASVGSDSAAKADIDENDVAALRSRVAELEKDRSEFESLYRDTSRQLRDVQSGLDEARIENDRLKERLSSAESALPGTPAAKEKQVLRDEIEKLRENFDQVEMLRDQYKMQSVEQQKTIADLRHKIDVLSKEVDEAKALKDDFQVLQVSASKVTKLESTVENYKKKLEEMSDLKQRLKEAEDQTKDFMRQKLDLEDDMAKFKLMKTQYDKLRESSMSLQSQVAELQLQLQEANFQANKFQEQTQLKASEIEQLKSKLSEAENRLINASHGGSGLEDLGLDTFGGGRGGEGDSLAQSLSDASADVREKLAKLERENAKLKAAAVSGGGESESVALLQGLLDDAKEYSAKLERDVMETRGKLLRLEDEKAQLQAKVEEAEKQQVRAGTDSMAWQQLAEAERATAKLRAENEDLLSKNQELERRAAMLDEEMRALQKDLVEQKKQLALLSLDKQEMVNELTAKLTKEHEAALSERVAALESEKESLRTELQGLQATIVPTTNALENLQIKLDTVMSAREQLETRVKEQLEKINKLLTEKDELQSKYSDVQEKFINLQNEVSSSKEVVQKLQGELTTKEKDSTSLTELAALRVEARQLEAALNLKEREISDLRLQNVELKGQNELTLSQLQQKLADNDKLMRQAEEAEMYIKKYKGSAANSSGTTAIVESDLSRDLRARLELKEKEVNDLKVRIATSKEEYTKQQKLMTTAWYTLALKLQQTTVSERLQAKSFLARQRSNLTGRLTDA